MPPTHSWGALKLGMVVPVSVCGSGGQSKNYAVEDWLIATIVDETKRRVEFLLPDGERIWLARGDERLGRGARQGDARRRGVPADAPGPGLTGRPLAAPPADPDAEGEDASPAERAGWQLATLKSLPAEESPLYSQRSLGSGGIFKGAACEVLRQNRCLMSTGQITRAALEQGLLGSLPGKTPAATMASALYTDLKRGKGKHGSTFARPVEGLFGLRSWAADPALAPLLEPEVAEAQPTRTSSGRLASVRSLARSRSPEAEAAPRARPLTPPKESPRTRDEASAKRPKLAPRADAFGIDSLLAAAEALMTPTHRDGGAAPSVFACAATPAPCAAAAAPSPPRCPNTPLEGDAAAQPSSSGSAGALQASPPSAGSLLADRIELQLRAAVPPPLMPAALWSFARTCMGSGRTEEAEAAAERSFSIFYASAPSWPSVEAAKAAFTQLTQALPAH